ncbi:hypothetical protein CIW50_18770 [Tardiphaga sp. P9-11]|nr:hypothetical protein CIW50_18770 [Tardiphaga sp. P9-11]
MTHRVTEQMAKLAGEAVRKTAAGPAPPTEMLAEHWDAVLKDSRNRAFKRDPYPATTVVGNSPPHASRLLPPL